MRHEDAAEPEPVPKRVKPCPDCAKKDAAIDLYKRELRVATDELEAAEARATAAEQERDQLRDRWITEAANHLAVVRALTAAKQREAEKAQIIGWYRELADTATRATVDYQIKITHKALASPSTPSQADKPKSFCAQCMFGEGLRVAMVDGQCPRCVIDGDKRSIRPGWQPPSTPSPAPPGLNQSDTNEGHRG